MSKKSIENLTSTLPFSAQKIIEHYLNLHLGGKKVPMPYYINEDATTVTYKSLANRTFDYHINYRVKKTKLRALIGKGSPQEIEIITKKYAQKFKFNLEKSTVVEIQQFMMKHGIGVDCSALVVWILNEVTKEQYGKSVWNYIDFSAKNIFKKIITFLRPVENISVKVLSDMRNSVVVETILHIKPGDMIVSWGGEHILLVTKVSYDETNKPASFEYINSTWWYHDQNGVRKGKVNITKPKGYLLEQEWIDMYKGENWTYEGIKSVPKKSKILRLKIFR